MEQARTESPGVRRPADQPPGNPWTGEWGGSVVYKNTPNHDVKCRPFTGRPNIPQYGISYQNTTRNISCIESTILNSAEIRDTQRGVFPRKCQLFKKLFRSISDELTLTAILTAF